MLDEKYRPEKISDVVGQPTVVKMIQSLVNKAKLEPEYMLPHLLFEGPPGVGKTSTAHAIARELDVEVKELNASLYRTIETVRETILKFARHASLYQKRKVIILDEVDGLWADAQISLNRVMEKLHHNVIFILCCNDSKKVNRTLKSRCANVHFLPLQEKDMIEALSNICRTENMQFQRKSLESIVRSAEGDLRQAINNLELQQEVLNSPLYVAANERAGKILREI